MKIHLRKTSDGVLLTVTRRDGTTDAQRSRHAGFFGPHDLLHFAVETVLGLRQAFFGLLAQGWPFSAFSDKEDPRYRALPQEALLVEHLVGVLGRRALDAARHDPELRGLWSAEVTAEWRASAGVDVPPLSGAQLLRVSDRFEALLDQWAQVGPGGELELDFPERADT